MAEIKRRLPTILTVDESPERVDAAHSLSDRAMLMLLYSTESLETVARA